MRLALLFARRYLFAKRGADGKGRNAVNIITGISVSVIAVVTAAMVIVLSTLNGIATLVDSLYSPFDQDITITAAKGKTFERSAVDRAAIEALPAVDAVSWTVEENVMLANGDRRAVVTLKGVEPAYIAMSGMTQYLYAGHPDLFGPSGPLLLVGAAIRDELAILRDDGIMRPLELSAAQRGKKLSRYRQAAFNRERMAMGGAFSINLEFDQRFVIADLGTATKLLGYSDAVGALELRCVAGSDVDRLAQELQQRLGADFLVRTRYQKNELMYRTNATEKWFSFVVLVFIGTIGAFNIIASLTLMMIEKQRDMRTLTAMGAGEGFLRRVFFLEGLCIVALGIVIGLLAGSLICWAQITFGLVALQDSVVESYPVEVHGSDLLLVTVTVALIGALASWVPLRRLGKRLLQTTSA